MTKTVQARLDEDSIRLLEQLTEADGSSVSDVVRKAIKELAAKQRSVKFLGIGAVESGVRDLGSNPNHLKNFGR